MASVTYATVYSQGLRDEELNAAFQHELEGLRSGSPRICPHHVGGERVEAGPLFEREDPSCSERIVSRGYAADAETIFGAVSAARRALPEWRARSVDDRAASLRRTIEAINRRRAKLAALLACETGKARADAFAEVEECMAIADLFCRQVDEDNGYAIDLKSPSTAARAQVVLRPYGVFGVIAPFNFPLAIPLSMVGAALIMGNTVVFKPSAFAPACGEAFRELFDCAELPNGVLNVVQGGPAVGESLAGSDIDGLAFTGSAEVGLQLKQRLTQAPYVRPVFAEMGGKNPAIITAAVPDLDAAATAVARSAFGGTGQKCNACSRAIVLAEIYEDFVSRLCDVASTLKPGDPADADVFAGPLIDRRALDRFKTVIRAAEDQGQVRIGGEVPGGPNYFATCTVIDGLPREHWLARKELFVPVLTVIPAETFDDALEEANAVQYGLAAGLFSDSASDCERFLDRIEAGIVFVNNPGGATTGVWPGSQTMSGWKASGSTGKGGFGPWYIQQFGREQSRTVFA